MKRNHIAGCENRATSPWPSVAPASAAVSDIGTAVHHDPVLWASPVARQAPEENSRADGLPLGPSPAALLAAAREEKPVRIVLPPVPRHLTAADRAYFRALRAAEMVVWETAKGVRASCAAAD